MNDDPLIDALAAALLGELDSAQSPVPAIPTADDLDPFSTGGISGICRAPTPPLPSRPREIREIPGQEKWRRPNAPRITLEQCVNGTGPMVKMLPGEIAGKVKGVDGARNPKAERSAKPKQSPVVMTFGRHRDKLIVDVAESDPQYLAWCIREDVQGMREKCEKLGITEDDFS